MLERASRAALDLFFPPQCAICGRGGTLLCDGCVARLPAADDRRCDRCWTSIAYGVICNHCRSTPPAFVTLRSAFVMEDGARDLTHMLKYQGLTSLAEPMTRCMLERIDLSGAGLVVPVPLHRGRQRSRGYNQAVTLGRHMARMLALPFDAQAANRVRATKPLAKTMHRDERRAIVAGAFEGRRARVENRKILLVDDVATTGATLDSCAGALLEAGAGSVRCVTWARAD